MLYQRVAASTNVKTKATYVIINYEEQRTVDWNIPAHIIEVMTLK